MMSPAYLTGAHVRKTYGPRPIYLSRLAFMGYTCQRVLDHGNDLILEASEGTHDTRTDLSSICFVTQPRRDDMNLTSKDVEGAPAAAGAKLASEDKLCVVKPSEGEPIVWQDMSCDVEIGAESIGQVQEAEDAEEAVEEDEEAVEEDEETDEKDQPLGHRDAILDADIIRMKTLRSTTSAHDDWLHRGPYLNDLPFHTYTEYVNRVRRPRQPPADHQIFEFEPHYALSRSYCQQIETPARTPVLEALKFAPPGAGRAEENALYKHLIGSLTRCTCADGCADVMLMKPFLQSSAGKLALQSSAGKPAADGATKLATDDVTKPVTWSFHRAWKPRRAELEVLAHRGETKIKRAMRIACIKDTTMVRGWLPAASSVSSEHRQNLMNLLRTTLAQMALQRYNVIWPDAWNGLLAFLGVANIHDDQLTLAEFSALRTRRLVQNLDNMAVSRTVQLSQKTGKQDEVDEFHDEPKCTEDGMRSEFMGGGEHCEYEDMPEEHSQRLKVCARASFDLNTIIALLRRDQEIEAANKPGRHREAHVQMKAFAEHFGESLTAPLPPLDTQNPVPMPGLLGRNPKCAIAHQREITRAMKKDQADLKESLKQPQSADDPAAIIAALENLQRQEEREASCVLWPLCDVMKGPKHVAQLIMQKQTQEGRTLNDEQKLLYALWVDSFEQAWQRRPDTQKYELPLDVWLFDMIIDGGGGCGKTMLIVFFLVPLCRAFFGQRGVVLAAPSNKAARGIFGKTFHSLLGFTPDTSLRTSALALTTQKRVKLERQFLPMGAFVKDEFSMMAGQMNHAACLLATYAREGKFLLRREDYAKPRERAGRVAVMLDSGDHLQLPPVPKRNSLFAPLNNTSQEHRVGAAIFRNANYVFQMKQMMRFKDTVLVRILNTMRTVGGKALAESDWEALLRTEHGSAEKPAATTEWYNTSYLWSVVAMASFVQARQSARIAKQVLVYIQAVDVIQNLDSQQPDLVRNLYRSCLQVPSLTKTKRLPSFCLLHMGMEVRLTTTLANPWAVQDATATVLEIHEEEEHRCNSSEKLLTTLPTVLIKLHDCDHIFLPCEPCQGCANFNPLCSECTDKREQLKGIYAVQPITRTWRYEGPELECKFVNVSRTQLPLAPGKVLPLYSMQGMTANPGLLAHWVMPQRLDPDIKWLICYVILSRVPSLEQLVSIGLSPKIREIIETGPPEGMVQCFNTQFADKIEATNAAALQAKRRLGW